MIDIFSDRTEQYSPWSDSSNTDDKVRSMVKRHFLNLAGTVLDYYGADGGDNTFKVDDVVFKVLEDPDDGYRSMLGAIDYTEEHNSIFFRQPIAKVRIETYDGVDEDEWSSQSNKGYQLVDVTDGHVWLRFGTHNYDDYYPMFIFRHTPKERQ